MLKKITALLLVLLLCLFAVGCSNNGTPDGMHLVSIESEPFKLYVPDAWTNNTSSGISSAFLSGTNNVAVSARYYTHPNGDLTSEEYLAECTLKYSETMKQFNLLENTSAVLGGQDAMRATYTAIYGEQEFKFIQYVTKYNGDFITLTFRTPTELYDSYSEHFGIVTDAFVLCEKATVTEDAVTDKKTPEGMKIASSEVVEYRLYVPNTWVCNSQSGVSEAYYPESGKPNVTLTSYSPADPMSAEQYFAECEKQYREQLSGYTLVLTEDRTVAERAAKAYTYTVTYGESTVKIMQTVLVYNQMVYSFTYTALEDSFDAHMEDVGNMLDVFRFR